MDSNQIREFTLNPVCSADMALAYVYHTYNNNNNPNKKLGRYRGREGKIDCSLCRNECENVSHVLLKCSAYSSTKVSFMKKLQSC